MKITVRSLMRFDVGDSAKALTDTRLAARLDLLSYKTIEQDMKAKTEKIQIKPPNPIK